MVEVVLEKFVRCPDCKSLLRYSDADVHALWRADHTGGREKLGDGIVCPKCQELIVTEQPDRT